jgi:hypothetical protein
MKTKKNEQEEYMATIGEVLKSYGMKNEQLPEYARTFLSNFLRLAQTAARYDNPFDHSYVKGCGEIQGEDNVHYQVQIVITPNKKEWVQLEGVYIPKVDVYI